jgi:hypothetical protein
MPPARISVAWQTALRRYGGAAKVVFPSLQGAKRSCPLRRPGALRPAFFALRRPDLWIPAKKKPCPPENSARFVNLTF